MRILFLDDMETRHKHFRRTSLGNVEIVPAWTADEAIKLLQEQEFDIVSLDHDLTELQTLGFMDAEKTGYSVACFIAEMPEEKRPKVVVVHSLNPSGAVRMMQALEGKVNKLIRKPFIM
jgi:CheY-like chemotaxis protein